MSMNPVVGLWELVEAVDREYEVVGGMPPDTLPELLAALRPSRRRMARFTPGKSSVSTLDIRADGTFEHLERGNKRFDRYSPDFRSLAFVDSRWAGRWTDAQPPDLAVLREERQNEEFYDRVRLEEGVLVRTSVLVWDGLYVTITIGRYARRPQA